MFINNQRVVCIDDNFREAIKKYFTALPEEGMVYVVRGMSPAINSETLEDDICVYLVGLQNPCSSKAPFRERGFRCERFRPLDELTEAEILQLSNPVELGKSPYE